MPNILFRADAEQSIGIGDLISLIYLSREFAKNSWRCFFAVRDFAPAVRIIQQHKIEDVFFIPKESSAEEEIAFLQEICRSKNIDCLFLEITKYSLKDYVSLGRPAPIKACVNFDGVITPDFDLVVNWCVSSTDSLYAQYKKDSTRFLLGFENTILLDYFDLANIQKRSHSDKIQKILVTMGGVDEFDLTARVVKGLSLIDEEWEVRIILGPGYSRKAELLKIIDLGKSNFSLKENIDNLYADYLWADLAFSAGGLSSSELVATKTPAILVAAYEHQVARCQYFHQQQWAYYTGRENLFDTQTVKNSLDYLQKNIGDMRNNLQKNEFRGGNEKIFAHISSYRQSAKLVS